MVGPPPLHRESPGPAVQTLAVSPILPTVRHYAWGSHRAIPELLGQPESALPVAELWFGAHPSGPSTLAADHSTSLADLVAVSPVDVLGAASVERFGPRLPFLLKILAAEKPLSLQVHPSLSQAQAGFADEVARSVSAAARNYHDDNHKPELLCALTEFWALAGFRPVAGTVEMLRAFRLAEAGPFVNLTHPVPDVRATVAAVLSSDRDAVRELVATAWASAHRIVSARLPWYNEARWFLRIAERAHDDPGLLIALLLNLVRLEPGQFIFVPAGQVHAYLHGTGVEIMASSDNVLRCGLTAKHVDRAELLRIADFSAATSPVQSPTRATTGELVFRTPVEDFALSRFDVVLGNRFPLGRAGPQIVLCVKGTVSLRSDGSTTTLTGGHAAFVAAGRPVTLSGSGRAFRATTNLAT